MKQIISGEVAICWSGSVTIYGYVGWIIATATTTATGGGGSGIDGRTCGAVAVAIAITSFTSATAVSGSRYITRG